MEIRADQGRTAAPEKQLYSIGLVLRLKTLAVDHAGTADTEIQIILEQVMWGLQLYRSGLQNCRL